MKNTASFFSQIWTLHRVMNSAKPWYTRALQWGLNLVASMVWLMLLIAVALAVGFGSNVLRDGKNIPAQMQIEAMGHGVPDDVFDNPYPTLPALEQITQWMVARQKEKIAAEMAQDQAIRGSENNSIEISAETKTAALWKDLSEDQRYEMILQSAGDPVSYFFSQSERHDPFWIVSGSDDQLMVYVVEKAAWPPHLLRYIEEGLGPIEEISVAEFFKQEHYRLAPAVLLVHQTNHHQKKIDQDEDETTSPDQINANNVVRHYSVATSQGLTFSHHLARNQLGHLINFLRQQGNLAYGEEYQKRQKQLSEQIGQWARANGVDTLDQDKPISPAPAIDPRMILFLFLFGGSLFIGTLLGGPLALDWEQKRARHAFEPYALMRAPIGVILGKEILGSWMDGFRILSVLFLGAFLMNLTGWGFFGAGVFVLAWAVALTFLWFELTVNLFLVAAFQSRWGRVLGRLLIIAAILIPLTIVRAGLSYYWYQVNQGMSFEQISVVALGLIWVILLVGAWGVFRLTVWRIGRYNTGLVPLR